MTRIFAVTLGAVVVSFATGLYVGEVTTLEAQQRQIYECARIRQPRDACPRC